MYSFDVFDTCLTRTYVDPKDLFLNVARILFPDERVARTVAKNRVMAELNARQATSKEDVCLSDIYVELREIYKDGFKIDFDEMQALELRLELDSVRAIQSTLQLVNRLEAEGERVIFISDMYLPPQVIVKQLKECGYQNACLESVYVSGRIGLCKSSGNLFDHIKKALKIDYTDWVHYGDNYISDYSVPKGLGICSKHIVPSKIESRYANVFNPKSISQRLVGLLKKESKYFRRVFNDIKNDDLDIELFKSRSISVSNITLKKYATEQSSLIGFSSFVAAPVVYIFVCWVLEMAQQRGLGKLYFVARNGQIFYKIAKIVCDARGLNISPRYLYGSRNAWYFASVSIGDVEGLIALYGSKYNSLSLYGFFTKIMSDVAVDLVLLEMGLSKPEAKAVVGCEGFKDKLSGLSAAGWKLIWDAISLKRDVAQDYFRQEGLLDGSVFAIVDIGWSLSSHNALFKILNHQASVSFSGFYWGVHRRHEVTPIGAPFEAFIDNSAHKDSNWLFKLGAMIFLEDVVCAADHPSTLGYVYREEEVIPIFGSATDSILEGVSRQIQAVIVDYSSEMESSKVVIDGYGRLASSVMGLYKKFYIEPDRLEVESLSDGLVCALTSHDSENHKKLARPIRTFELFGILFRYFYSRPEFDPDWTWFSGAVAVSNPLVKRVGLLMLKLDCYLSLINRRVYNKR